MKRFKRLLLLALVLGAGLWAFLFSLANSEPAALDLVFARLEPAALSVWRRRGRPPPGPWGGGPGEDLRLSHRGHWAPGYSRPPG